VEQWIYSLGVSRVSHLVPLENEMQTQTNDICFPISCKESENANQVSSSLKMLKESSVQNCQETDGETQKEHQFCCMSSENWKEWVTKQRQEYSVRVKSEHLIREKESLSWGTPNTMDGLPSRSYEAMKRQATNGGRKNRQRPGNLREQVDPLMCQAYQEASAEANWPTMTAMEADKAGYYNKGQMGQSLSAMAKRGELSWPTARTSDAEGGAIETEMTQEGFRSKRHNSNQFFGAKLRDAVETHEKLCGPQDQDNNNTSGSHRELWPTPDTTQANDGVPWEKFKKDMDARRQRVKEAGLNGSGRSPNLCAAVQNPKWATPCPSHLRNHDEPIENYLKRVQDYKDGKTKGKPGISLGVQTRQEQEKQWRTPTAQEAGAKVETLYTKDGQPAKVGQRAYRKTPKGEMVLQSQTINQQVEMETKQPSMRLNPRWVETLMGLPVGWCLPSCTQPVTPEMMNSVYSEME
jgi:hypothetical protein